MTARYFIMILSVPVVLIFAHARASAAEGDIAPDSRKEQGKMFKQVDGLRLVIPEDMPVVKRGSLVVPMSTEEYVSIKFSELDKRIERIEEEIKNISLEISLIKQDISSRKDPLSVLAGPQESGTPALQSPQK
ncbi:MAG: hypothetical protein WC301_04935 [Candidatus Omnitrophota bacterium]|jgi:hypothetical protein